MKSLEVVVGISIVDLTIVDACKCALVGCVGRNAMLSTLRHSSGECRSLSVSVKLVKYELQSALYLPCYQRRLAGKVVAKAFNLNAI